MAETINVKIYDSLRENLHLNENEAKNFAKDFTATIKEEIADTRTDYATKSDLKELESKITKQIYTVGLAQFLAIVATITVIMAFMLSRFKS